jgi:hypothetical protein
MSMTILLAGHHGLADHLVNLPLRHIVNAESFWFRGAPHRHGRPQQFAPDHLLCRSVRERVSGTRRMRARVDSPIGQIHEGVALPKAAVSGPLGE